jgi:hypothetical protein
LADFSLTWLIDALLSSPFDQPVIAAAEWEVGIVGGIVGSLLIGAWWLLKKVAPELDSDVPIKQPLGRKLSIQMGSQNETPLRRRLKT